MAERRMFTQKIVDSDAFLDMPLSAQALYFHLSMRADDDGFVNNPKKIQRIVCASEDDLKLLILKRFLLCFESGVIVIKHWRMHNSIRKDRYTPTQYQEEFNRLGIKENGSYTELAFSEPPPTPQLEAPAEPQETTWQPSGNQAATQVRLGKDRLGKERLGEDEPDKPAPRTRFVKPTLAEIKVYCKERRNKVDPERFLAYYESNGWKVGKNPMKDWKAAVRNWERNSYSPKPQRDTGANWDDLDGIL